MQLKLIIFALLFISSADIFCMLEKKEELLEVSIESMNEDIFFWIFQWLLPSEKKPIPLVCQGWLSLSINPSFAQNSYKLFKSLSKDRVDKGSCYLVLESFRLEKALPDLVTQLIKSPYFFNLGEEAREKSEKILYSKFTGEPLCLIRNSSKSHIVAISFITDEEFPVKFADISASVDSININNWLAKKPNMIIAKKSQKTLSVMTDDNKNRNKKIRVHHSAVMLLEEAESKKLTFFYKGSPDIAFASLELLIEYLRKNYKPLKKRSSKSLK
jgi:hypothetical protein